MNIAPVTHEEQQILWFFGYHREGLEPGSFRKALLEAMFRADRDNFAKLRSVFPEAALAVDAWRYGDLAQRAGLAHVPAAKEEQP